jgi:SAM-dependent methyltransferase
MSPQDDRPAGAMADEFDTVAEWTAEAALALGPDFHIPAGCRGSGRPAALDWLLDRLDPGSGLLVDVGAGVGGPSAYAAQRNGARPVLIEPAAGACRAARRLFALPVIQAEAAALPLPDARVATVWSLGVLCTTDDQLALLREVRRVLRPDGRAGLLVFVATRAVPPGQPEGNDFPTFPLLHQLLADAGLHAVDQQAEDALPAEPADWRERADAVAAEIDRRHGPRPEWQTARRQTAAISRLLGAGDVVGHLLVVQRR